jgi:hypothetical protein
MLMFSIIYLATTISYVCPVAGSLWVNIPFYVITAHGTVLCTYIPLLLMVLLRIASSLM